MGKAQAKPARAERCGVCQAEVYFAKVPEGMADEQGDWIALEKREVYKYNPKTQAAKLITGTADRLLVMPLHDCEEYANLRAKISNLMDDNADLLKKVEHYEGGGVPADKEGFDSPPEEPIDKPLPIEQAALGVCECGHTQADHADNGICVIGDCPCWGMTEPPE